MRTVGRRPSFQGDVMIRRIDAPPPGLRTASTDDGDVIVAHSETGHHHVVAAGAATLLEGPDEFSACLHVRAPCELRHLRDVDTHASFRLDPGYYEVRRQRRSAVEGWRRVED